MELTIVGRHVEITPALRTHVEQKAVKFFRYSFKTLMVDVRLTVEKYRHEAEFIIRVNGRRIAAKKETDEMYQSIDLAAQKAEQLLRKIKGKSSGHKSVLPVRNLVPKPSKPPTVKKRRALIVPTLGLADAVAKLDGKDPEIFVFIDDTDETVQLLVRGKNGHLETTELILE